jgi:hypothetical protein
MRGLNLALLLLLVSGMAGCVNAACIQRGDDPSYDRCVDDTTHFWCEECNLEEDELPIRCDDYEVATSCEDEGFEYECDGIWSRVNELCD